MKQDDYGNKDGIGKKNSDEMAQDIKWRWRLNRAFCKKNRKCRKGKVILMIFQTYL